MIYDWGKDSLPLANVYDADGNDAGEMLSCDTETGEVVRPVRDEAGLVVTDPASGEMITSSEFLPAPLRVEFAASKEA